MRLPGVITRQYTQIMVYAYIVAGCWIAFLSYWVISGPGAKKDAARHTSIWISLGVRLLLGLIIGLSLAQPTVRHLELASARFIGSIGHTVGAVLSAAGIGVAIWARAYLGKTWSDQPSIKVGHELVTSGPYRLVRHPIYTGVLLALVGTTLATGLAGLAAFVCVASIFIYRIGAEERILARTFPEEYPGYRKRTKALIPFVF